MKRNMVISIIGRPNVGKSSLFNCLLRKQNKAMTHDRPGVTRDRHYGIVDLGEDVDAIIVDTGGFYSSVLKEDTVNEKFFNIMTDHAKMAIEESDLILFVVDCREGINPFDEEICRFIRGEKKEFWLVVNKYDSDAQAGRESEFYSLGVENKKFHFVSCAHNLGINNLRDQLSQRVSNFNESHERLSPELQKGVTPKEEVVGKVALIGGPNSGKSTLLNKLLGAQRALVSDIPGTTVDPIEGFFDLYFEKDPSEFNQSKEMIKSNKALIEQYESFRKNNEDFFTTMKDAYDLENEDDTFKLIENNECEDELLEGKKREEQEDHSESKGFWKSIHIVDTAGIRRQSLVQDYVEEQSVYRSLRCITESDVVIYMLDATKGVRHQDRRLLDIALEKGKSVVVCLNKFDLIKGSVVRTNKEIKDWLLDLRDKIPWLEYCELLMISAKNSWGLNKLKKSLTETLIIRKKMIPTGELNRAVFDLVERHPIVVKNSGGKRLKVKYASMVKSAPPTFLLFSNRSKGIPENYKKYLKNNLRNYFNLINTPVHLLFRTGKELKSKGPN